MERRNGGKEKRRRERNLFRDRLRIQKAKQSRTTQKRIENRVGNGECEHVRVQENRNKGGEDSGVEGEK